jgi:hypothetical protein
MSIVMGRDPLAESLLDAVSPSFRLAIPSICYMEALSAIRHELWVRECFQDEMDRQIVQLERNRTSPHATTLLTHLNPCLAANDSLSTALKDHFDRTLNRLCQTAEFLELSAPIVGASLSGAYVDDPTDNLIVCSIIDHARGRAAETKAFLSGDTKDFGSESVRTAFRNVGIDKNFTEAKNVLGWLKSLSNP